MRPQAQPSPPEAQLRTGACSQYPIFLCEDPICLRFFPGVEESPSARVSVGARLSHGPNPERNKISSPRKASRCLLSNCTAAEFRVTGLVQWSCEGTLNIAGSTTEIISGSNSRQRPTYIPFAPDSGSHRGQLSGLGALKPSWSPKPQATCKALIRSSDPEVRNEMIRNILQACHQDIRDKAN